MFLELSGEKQANMFCYKILWDKERKILVCYDKYFSKYPVDINASFKVSGEASAFSSANIEERCKLQIRLVYGNEYKHKNIKQMEGSRAGKAEWEYNSWNYLTIVNKYCKYRFEFRFILTLKFLSKWIIIYKNHVINVHQMAKYTLSWMCIPPEMNL